MLTATLQREELKYVSTTAEEKGVSAQVHADCFLYPGKWVWLSKNPYLALRSAGSYFPCRVEDYGFQTHADTTFRPGQPPEPDSAVVVLHFKRDISSFCCQLNIR